MICPINCLSIQGFISLPCIEKELCLDFLGDGAYVRFADGGDFVLAYNVKDHTCERYRLQKTE